MALFFCVLAISASMACRVFRRGRRVRRQCGAVNGGVAAAPASSGGGGGQLAMAGMAAHAESHGDLFERAHGAGFWRGRASRACSSKDEGDLMGGPRQTGAAAVGSVRSPMHEGNVNSASEPIQQKALHMRYRSGVLRRGGRRRERLQPGVFPTELQRCMAIPIFQVM